MNSQAYVRAGRAAAPSPSVAVRDRGHWWKGAKRRKKPEHTAATPSEPALYEVEVCRGKSNHGSILRQPCRYYLKGTCTRTPGKVQVKNHH